MDRTLSLGMSGMQLSASIIDEPRLTAHDGGSFGWVHVSCRSRQDNNERSFFLTVLDESDQLKWTFIVKSTETSVRLKIPSSSVKHRFLVIGIIVREAANPVGGGGRSVSKHFEIISEDSCCAARRDDFVLSGFRRMGLIGLSETIFDVRPRLRNAVGVNIGGKMRTIIDKDSTLPADGSMSFSVSAKSASLQIVHGKNGQTIVGNKAHIFNVELYFLSKSTRNGRLDLTLDDKGTLTALTAIESTGEERFTPVDHQAIFIGDHVINPKVAIDTNEPRVNIETTSNGETAITLETTYDSVHSWKITIRRSATPNKGHLFEISVNPNSRFVQKFLIPPGILEAGIQYKVTIEGLSRLENDVDNFRHICKQTITHRCPPIERSVSAAASGVTMPSNTRTTDVRHPYRDTDVRHPNRATDVRHPNPDTDVLLHSRDRFTADDDFQIRIERRAFYAAAVVITHRGARSVDYWLINIRNSRSGRSQDYQTPTDRFDFPLQFYPGMKYTVTVRGMLEGRYIEHPERAVEFRAELTIDELKTLQRKAINQVAHAGHAPCRWLYRNKSVQYFNDIMRNRRAPGIMEVYAKDNSGDPASPINLQINGLFFMASVQQGSRTGEPIQNSPFGPLRICVPAEELLEMAPKIYFADFYCMRGRNHQVTLVMTKPGSEVDRFCSTRLLPIDLHDRSSNPFLFYDQFGQLQVTTQSYFLVEMLFTENLDISRYPFSTVPTIGKGSSTVGGILKNSQCTTCNLPKPVFTNPF